jgi:uncharacterized membrane protein YcaP (DUF421 family)
MSIWKTDLPWWNLGLRAAVVYASVVLLLRLAGKRQISQMGMTEFVALLLISNAVQNSMNGGDNSLTGGLILAGVIIGLSILMAYLTYRSKKLENIVQGRPTLLIHKGQILYDHLRDELLTVRELGQLLRKQGIHHYDEIEEAVLESDGFVSITRKGDEEKHRRMEARENRGWRPRENQPDSTDATTDDSGSPPR